MGKTNCLTPWTLECNARGVKRRPSSTSPSLHGFTSTTNYELVENPPQNVRASVRPTSKMQKVLWGRAARNLDFLAGFVRHLEVGPFYF
jgi:hypothetical protein